MERTAILDHRALYRLPWTLSDNSINWLEPTTACNLYCDGCYRKNDPKGHKTLERIRHELDVFNRLRKADGVSIAGGDPLVHPEIEKIVEMVARDGLKPIINTNGMMLTKEKLHQLKDAGVAGFTFHIDSGQQRPHMKGKSEVELNDLRLKYAEMLAEEGGVGCAFNATVYEHTLKYVPDIVAWGQEHIDIVQTIVFIAFRAAPVHRGYNYYVGDNKVDMTPIMYAVDEEWATPIMSTDIVAEIRKKFPDFRPCAYLNGTERPDHFKWLLAARIGTKDRIYGYAGPKFMELTQTLHHFRHGTYLAYTKPEALARAKAMLALAPLDSGVARAGSAFLRDAVSHPAVFFKRLHLQSVMIIPPADFMPNGAISMCDGCPDITVYDDKLVWSCRMD